MLMQILLHTPRWVFGLFAALLWLGARQLTATSPSLSRMTLMPIAMGGLSIYGVASAFGDSIVSLLAWAAVAFATLALVLQRGLPAGTRYDMAARRFHVAGTAVPLMLMMGIFFTKYIVGVLLVMHPEFGHQPAFADTVSALYGAFTGIFIGRAIRLWRLAMRTESTALAA